MSIARHIALSVLGCALLAAPLTRADDAINEEAQKHFKAGVNLLQDPDGARYEEAYHEFEVAYAASNSPKILGNIGLCALKLERDGEAIAAYTRYLQEVRDVDAAEAAQITRDVATLRSGLVHVTLLVDTPGAMVLDKRMPARGEPIANRYGPVTGKIELGLRPGHHIVEVKAGAESMPPWEFDASPGATLSQKFAKPLAESAPRSGSRVLPWVVTGVGAATLAAGGVFGAITLNKANAISKDCPANQCPVGYALDDKKADAIRFIRTTDALLIGGGVIAITGLWLVFATGGSESSHPASTATAGATLSQPLLGCSPLGCMASMNGTF